MGFLSIAGSLVLIRFMNSEWYRKESWKFKKSQVAKIDSINFKKLSKQLDIQAPATPEPESKTLIESLKGLDLDKVKGLLGAVQTDDYDELEPMSFSDDPAAFIMDYAQKNPEVAEAFLKKLNIGGGGTDETQGETIR